jgi:stage II sporulation protein D
MLWLTTSSIKMKVFNLCDGVHCQYYLGRNSNADISRAVARTQGNVIVDKQNLMISAAFHSNCGGQTVNSEDIWTIPTSYLKSVNDSFCLHQSNAQWHKKIAMDAYNAFLLKHNVTRLVNKKQQGKYIVRQEERATTDPHQIPLKLYRQHFNLRSTWFDMQVQGDSLALTGRGFGHGVGLCQQGAIEMIRRGYDYRVVIQHYYTDVRIIHYSELNYNFMP